MAVLDNIAKRFNIIVWPSMLIVLILGTVILGFTQHTNIY